MTDNAESRARAVTFQILQPLPLLPYGTSARIETLIAAALREAEQRGLEEAAVIAEDKYDRRAKYAAYRAGDFNIDHENAGDAIASDIRAQAASRRGGG
jgi:hypothetical protein